MTMNTTDTNIRTTAAHMLVTLSHAQLGMCDRALAMARKAHTYDMQHQLLESLHRSGGFVAQFSSIEDLTTGLIEAIATTEMNAILASEEDFEAFSLQQFPNSEGASRFIHTDIHIHLNQITTFHKLMDNLETTWENNNA